MICPICGYESSGNFCSNCGAPLEDDKDGYMPEEDYTFDEAGEDWLEYEEQEFPEEENTDASGWERYENIRQEKREPRSQTPTPGKDKGSVRKKNSGSAGTRAKDMRKDKKEQKKQQKLQQKEQRKRDDRVKSLEDEVEQLRSQREMEAAAEEPEKLKPARRRQERRRPEIRRPEIRGSERSGPARPKRSDTEDAEFENDNLNRGEFEGRFRRSDRTDSEGSEFGEAVAKGAVGIVVLLSRLMQLASTVLMACMVAAMAQSFWRHGQELGDIRLAVEERNYGLAFYVGFAGFTLFMGIVWCLWILSRKGAGGGVRMRKYDTGRGFLPFLICLATILTTGIAAKQIPIEAEAFRGIGSGVIAALEAVNTQWEILFFSSTVGAVLSLVRKIMRV